MGAIASQITSLTIVYWTVYSDAYQRKHQSSASLAFVWGIHRDRWIPRTKGQLRGKCFHLMTSSWIASLRKISLNARHMPFSVSLLPASVHVIRTLHNDRLLVRDYRISHESTRENRKYIGNFVWMVHVCAHGKSDRTFWMAALIDCNEVQSWIWNFLHFEAETQWSPFCRKHFQNDYIGRKLSSVASTEFCSEVNN